jgi:ectoine hydroxylase-related dioxygenase (phytanoyl-CoA dioxygenase family)
MDTATAIAAIREQGYVIIEEALDAATRTAIRTELDPWLEGSRFGRNDFEGFHTERVYALLAKSASTAAMIEHPQILGIVAAFLPGHFLLSAALAINVHPGETAQSFHRDDSGHAFAPMPRPAYGISTIWAFDDFTRNNGATEVVPGSHHWPQARVPLDTEAVKVIMPAGAVVVFAGSLYHRGGANRSDTIRLAITPQYCLPQMRQLENMTLAVPPETAAAYSPRIQELLGYSVAEPGFMGYVDGLHPRRMIDPAYRGRHARGVSS